MADFESLTSAELLRAEARVSNLVSIVHIASAHCATQLGIPDIMHKHGKPITLPELLATLPIRTSKASYFPRLLRALVHDGLLLQQKPKSQEKEEEEEEEEEEGGEDLRGYYYSLAPAGLLLQMKWLFVTSQYGPSLPKEWSCIADWFLNEEPTPFSTAYGESFWDFHSQQPNYGDAFNEFMAQDSKLIAKVLLDECQHVFVGLTTLVDVGGGTGTLAKAIAKSFPDLECIVFDLPLVVANLLGSDNLKFIAGDMFDKIPPANTVLLKFILHDWSDQDCVKILKNCKKAIPKREEGGKVIIIDMVMDYPGLDPEFVQEQILHDMTMMVRLGGKERNKKEWKQLFLAAGFSDYKITHTLGSRFLIELYP